jgi:hypothetical protein
MKDLKELSLLSAEILSDEGRYIETALVGAAGNKFGNTADLNVLNYKQSMESPYRDRYVEGIDEEQYKMSHNEVFEEVHVDDIPPGTKLLDSTWANKLRADGLTRCRLAIRGLQQIDGVHVDASDKAAPVVCDVTIRVMLILAIDRQYRRSILTRQIPEWRANLYEDPRWVSEVLSVVCYVEVVTNSIWSSPIGYPVLA